ncbi:MAG TPA: CoA transferase [Candidatus Limnocylindria bacterium]|jgi:benzylsuccinate CoA-transferase BbsE subunit|nr:CoA transferase [Candidatus Limnocylindria bacterium]
MTAPLEGLRVIEIAGDDVWGASAAAHAARILADLGADVIKVEPPSGDPVRRVPPFLGAQAGADRGLLWIALNANKRGVRLDLPREERRLRDLVARSDVVVQSREIVDDSWHPPVVVTTVTPYGLTGPLAGVPASDLEVTAASGALALAGEPGRAPVRTTLPQSPFWSGMYAAMGALFALSARANTGRGQEVDVSGQASMVTVHPPACVHWDVAKEEHRRLGAFLIGRSIVGARFRNIWECADGHVSFAIQGGPIGRHTGRMLAAWMRERGFGAPRVERIDWERFDNRTLTQDEVDALEADVAAFLRTLTKREFFAGVIERNMLGYPVADASDIYADAQLRAREFWQDARIDGATLPFPGGFALFDGVRPRVRRAPPKLGEHDAEILGAVTA